MPIQKTGLVCGTSKGQSLIEVSLVLAIIALLMLAARSFSFTSPARERAHFIDALNALASATYEQALASGVTHRLVMNMQQGHAYAQRETAASSPEEPRYERVAEIPSVALPVDTTLVDIVIDGRTEAAGSDRVQEVWIDMYPTGSTQEFSFSLRDERDSSLWSYTLNPFTAHFSPE